MNPEQGKTTPTDVLLSFWWISWFGILGGFIFVGGQEFGLEISNGGVASPFSLTLLTVIPLSWIVFFVADSKFKERRPVVPLTTVGTILAILTILGIFYFLNVANRVM